MKKSLTGGPESFLKTSPEAAGWETSAHGLPQYGYTNSGFGNPVFWNPPHSEAPAFSGDELQMALLQRYMRAVLDMVRVMPRDLALQAVAAPSDFSALARCVSDPRVWGFWREVDPLAGAVGRSIAHQRRLMEMAGEMLTSSQLEDLLGVKRQAIDKRRNASKLLALRMASDWLYPAFQFSGNETLPGLEDVLQAHAESDPWVILDILLAPDEALEGRTLLEAIQEGDARAVARHVAQASGDGFA